MVSGIPPRGDNTNKAWEETSPQHSVGSSGATDEDTSNSTDEVEDLDSRVSECAEEVFEAQEGTPRSEEYSSQYNLQGRVDQNPPGGFFRGLLRRICSLARRIWNAIFRTHQRSYSIQGRSNNSVDGSTVSERPCDGTTTSKQERSRSQEAFSGYNRRWKAGVKRVLNSPLKFKMKPNSNESIIASAKLMLGGLKRVDEVKALFLGIPLDQDTKQALIDDLPNDSKTQWEELNSLYETTIKNSIFDPASDIPALRTLLKLCMVPTLTATYESTHMVTSLSDFDPRRDYDQELALAEKIQTFAARGDDEQLLVRDMLFNLREKFITELEILVTKMTEFCPNLKHQLIDKTVEDNSKTLAKAYYHDDAALNNLLNALVKRFFSGWRRVDLSLILDE